MFEAIRVGRGPHRESSAQYVHLVRLSTPWHGVLAFTAICPTTSVVPSCASPSQLALNPHPSQLALNSHSHTVSTSPSPPALLSSHLCAHPGFAWRCSQAVSAVSITERSTTCCRQRTATRLVAQQAAHLPWRSERAARRRPRRATCPHRKTLPMSHLSSFRHGAFVRRLPIRTVRIYTWFWLCLSWRSGTCSC